MKITGVRPSRRTTSMRRPSIGRSVAQPRSGSTARSMWPCSRHWASNIGDFAGILTYSCRVGTMLWSHVFWTKSRILPVSSAMDTPQEAMRRPERISQSSWSSSGASAIRASLPQRRQWMNAGSRPTYVLSHFGHRAGGARSKALFVGLALAAAAAHRIRLGPIALSPFEMHPVHIGLALLTLDEIAPGRACLVLGAGGDLAATLEPPGRGRVEAVGEC